jgi:hypothetical protein
LQSDFLKWEILDGMENTYLKVVQMHRMPLSSNACNYFCLPFYSMYWESISYDLELNGSSIELSFEEVSTATLQQCCNAPALRSRLPGKAHNNTCRSCEIPEKKVKAWVWDTCNGKYPPGSSKTLHPSMHWPSQYVRD